MPSKDPFFFFLLDKIHRTRFREMRLLLSPVCRVKWWVEVGLDEERRGVMQRKAGQVGFINVLRSRCVSFGSGTELFFYVGVFRGLMLIRV